MRFGRMLCGLASEAPTAINQPFTFEHLELVRSYLRIAAPGASNFQSAALPIGHIHSVFVAPVHLAYFVNLTPAASLASERARPILFEHASHAA